jgi:membrane protease YdiL (CAAX protease family)
MIPGFHNLRLYSGILISPTSMPFTMYLNFDKTMAAVIIAVTSGIFFRQVGSFGRNAWRETFIISALCVSLLIPLAILSGYVQFDPKFPDSFWLWAFNNLCFVCFAEEVIFRGVIQTHLIQLANRWKLSPFIPILISSLLFALALPGHLQGGPLFVGFVTLSGLFYGYAYYKTKRLESAIVVHFIVNLTHFLLFSYPMAAR